MLQCPTCGYRTFAADSTVLARVQITATEDGEYSQEEIHLYASDWRDLQCGRCARTVREDQARDAFAAATLADCVPDDIYAWFEARLHDYPDPTSAGHASCLTIAAAWNFWRWQLDHGCAPPGADRACLVCGAPSETDYCGDCPVGRRDL
jgi:hypothetical protein